MSFTLKQVLWLFIVKHSILTRTQQHASSYFLKCVIFCDFSTDDYHKVRIASFPTTEISNTIWYAGSSQWQTCLHYSMNQVPRPFLLQLSFELATSHITVCLGQNSIPRCEICYLWNLRGFSSIELLFFFLVITDKICNNLYFALKYKY